MITQSLPFHTLSCPVDGFQYAASPTPATSWLRGILFLAETKSRLPCVGSDARRTRTVVETMLGDPDPDDEVYEHADVVYCCEGGPNFPGVPGLALAPKIFCASVSV
jgi:hypothetical protein